MLAPEPTAPIHDAHRAPFHQLDWPLFEQLLVDLLQEEDGIAVSELHGLPGPQTDFGVDVIGIRVDGGSELVSCKRYGTITVGQLETWSEEALKHWPARWHSRDVRRFILATSATNLAKIQIVDQVAKEMARFAALGVRYELWGPTRLTAKLRPHRRIAAAYLKEHWADAICGPAAPPAGRIAPASPLLDAGAVGQLAELQSLLSGEVGRQVAAAIEDLRSGRVDAALGFATEMREEPRWSQLSTETRGKVLRLEASAALTLDDIDGAEEKARQADALHADEEPRLAARIVAERGVAEDGLAVLGEPSSVAGRQLQAALLLSIGQRERGRAVLLGLEADDPDEPETLRLLAIERVGAGERTQALALVGRVERAAGSWTATLRTGAIVRYAMALSDSVGPEFALSPNPVGGELVRRDPLSQAGLSEANRLLNRIPAERVTHEDGLWRLAILANSDGRRGEAEEEARRLLVSRPGDPTTVAWSIARGLDVDLAPARSELERAYAAGADLPTVRVLGILLATSGAHAAGADLLETHLDAQDGEVRTEALEWIARLRGEGMDDRSEAMARAQQGDWGDAEALLDELLSARPPHPFGLTVAELAAGAGRWPAMRGHVDDLLAYGTATGVRLAAYAALNTDTPARALAVIDAGADAFGGTLPADMRRLRAEALARSGQFREALGEATSLSAAGRLDDALFEADLRARVGSVSQSVPVVRRALAEGALDAATALQWSQRLSAISPDLARDLVRTAVSQDLHDAHVTAALGQAITLGLDAEGARLMPRLAEKAARGDEDVSAFNIEEAQELFRQWRDADEHVEGLFLSGAIPSHLYVRGRADALLRMHRTNAAQDSDRAWALEPRSVRHGGRPTDHLPAAPYGDWRIHLDVTGLLEAHRAGLLDRLEAHPNGIAVSSHLPAVLQQMQHQPPGLRTARAAALQDIAELAASGAMTVAERPTGVRVRAEGEGEDAGVPLTQLAAALARAGAISTDEASLLAGGAPLPILLSIDLTAGLVPTAAAAAALAEAGLAGRAAAACALRLDADALEAIGSDLRTLEAQAETCALAASLAQRVGDGIAAGVYRTLPPGPDGSGSEPQLERQLIDLLSLPPIEGGVVWFDDRNLTGYVHAGSLPIVGTVEAVAAMRAAGVLSSAEADTVAKALRRSGAALVPFKLEEFTAPLLAAPVVGGRVAETPELRDVRRAFAATRSREPQLKVGPAEGPLADRPDEDLVARSTLRILSDGLEEVWRDGRHPIAECIARSDWLLSSTRVHRLLREPPGDRANENRLLFEAMQIGHCLDKAWELGGPRDIHRDHRLNFLNWCWQRLVVPRLGVPPGIVDAVADYLAQFYKALLRDRPGLGRVDPVAYERLLYIRARRLPQPILDRVVRAETFPNHARFTTVVSIRGRRVESGRFWRAVRRAQRYGEASARDHRGGRLRLRRRDDHVLVSGATRARVASDIPRVLAADAGGRALAIAAFVSDLDLAPADARGLAETAGCERNIGMLAKALQEAKDAAVVAKRREVATSLRERRGASLADLGPQDPERLAWHYRLGDGPSAAGEGWTVHAARHGPVAAFWTMAASPASLPDAAGLTAEELDVIVEGARTPVAIAQAGRLVREAGAGKDRLAAIAERLADAVERWGELFGAILRWSAARSTLDRAWSGVEPARRLALLWLHADWLLDAFVRERFEPAGLVGSFAVREEELDALDRITTTGAGPADQADPTGITPQVLLLHGVAAILGDLDAGEALPALLAERLDAALRREGGVVDPSVLLRRPELGDALDGFLTRTPVGLPASVDPSAARDDIVDRALEAVAADPADRDAWLAIVAFASRGLNAERTERLAALIDSVDHFAAAALGDAEPQPFVWRGALAPLAWGGVDIGGRIAAIARRCARQMAGPVLSGGPAELAMSELVETSLLASRTPDGGMDHGSTAMLLWTVATAWPAVSPQLRLFISRLLDGTAPTRAAPLWNVANDLNRLR